MTDAHQEARPVTNAQARRTALLVAGVLLLLAAWNYHRGRLTVVLALGSIGAALALTGLLVPPLARAFHTLWMRVATLLGWINSRVLLGLMFYGVLAPYNLIGRLVGRDPLNRRARPRETYWIPRKQTRQTKEQFERTF